MTCQTCDQPAFVRVYAAYDSDDVDGLSVHPGLRRYPSPMATVCATCLPVVMADDQSGFGATSQYVLKLVAS